MLDGKICLITGGGGGIGRATALEMTRQQCGGVMIGDIDDASGRETARLVEAAGGRAEFLHCDMRRSIEVHTLIDATVEAFGGLDILHNNAGVHESAFTDELAIETLPEEVFDTVYQINLRGPWLAMKHATPHLKRSLRNPSIINAASTGGITGHRNMNAYGATKAGLIQLTRCVAVDLAPEVRVNCYAPGGVDTPMVSRFHETRPDPVSDERRLRRQLIPRIGQPQEVASLVCYLASDAAKWITGATFTIDGGLLAWVGPG